MRTANRRDEADLLGVMRVENRLSLDWEGRDGNRLSFDWEGRDGYMTEALLYKLSPEGSGYAFFSGGYWVCFPFPGRGGMSGGLRDGGSGGGVGLPRRRSSIRNKAVAKPSRVNFPSLLISANALLIRIS